MSNDRCILLGTFDTTEEGKTIEARVTHSKRQQEYVLQVMPVLVTGDIRSYRLGDGLRQSVGPAKRFGRKALEAAAKKAESLVDEVVTAVLEKDGLTLKNTDTDNDNETGENR